MIVNNEGTTMDSPQIKIQLIDKESKDVLLTLLNLPYNPYVVGTLVPLIILDFAKEIDFTQLFIVESITVNTNCVKYCDNSYVEDSIVIDVILKKF